MKKILFVFTILIFSLSHHSFAQDLGRIKAVIDTLCSPSYNGRGYVHKGDSVAAIFIQKQFEQIGLQPFSQGFRQPFTFSVNTFPATAELKIAGKKLALSDDFLPDPACPSIKGRYKLVFLDSSWLKPNATQIKLLGQKQLRKTALVYPMGLSVKQLTKAWPADLVAHTAKAGLKIMQTKTRPTASLSQHQTEPVLHLRSAALSSGTKSIKIQIQSRFVESYATQNLIGYLPGTARPDSFIVFCAHYDHLGSIGSAVFAGANDNASGIAIMLEMARHYAKPNNRARYSMAFIAFAGEEIGLLGSDYYTKNPFFSLSKTRFVLNLDLMGSGESGLTVVNATACPSEFKTLQQLNQSKNLFASLLPRAPAANSDHYPFAQKGVPAFFFYLRGLSTAYHDIHDLPATLTFSGALPIMQLMIGFVDAISYKNTK